MQWQQTVNASVLLLSLSLFSLFLSTLFFFHIRIYYLSALRRLDTLFSKTPFVHPLFSPRMHLYSTTYPPSLILYAIFARGDICTIFMRFLRLLHCYIPRSSTRVLYGYHLFFLLANILYTLFIYYKVMYSRLFILRERERGCARYNIRVYFYEGYYIT